MSALCACRQLHRKARSPSHAMSIRPDLDVSPDTAQAIVNCVSAGWTVADVSNIHGGEIAAVYQIAFVGDHPPVVLKVYPDSLHWKMRKEANVLPLVHDRLSVAAPRVLLADDSKRLLGLNFILMTRLTIPRSPTGSGFELFRTTDSAPAWACAR